MPKSKLIIAFGAVYIGIICSLVFRVEQYERPMSYFILMAIAVVILGIKIVKTEHNKRDIGITFALVCLLTLTTQWSQLLIFPNSLFYSDTWYHYMITDKLMQGEANLRIDYYGMLAYHYLVGYSTSLGLTQKWAMMIFVGIPYTVLTSWVLYKLGKLIYTYKTGLMAALGLGLASMFIFFGIEILPSTLAITLAMLSIYLVILSSSDKRVSLRVITSIAAFALLVIVMFTNTLIASMAVMILLLLWLGLFSHKHVFEKGDIRTYPFLLLGVVFGLTMLAYWTFGTGQINILLRILGNEDLALFAAQFTPYGDVLVESGLIYSTDYVAGVIPEAYYWEESFVLTPSETVIINQYRPEIPMSEVINQYQSKIPFSDSIIKWIPILLFGVLGLYGVISCRNIIRHRPFAFALVLCAVLIVGANLANFALSKYFFLSRHVLMSQILLTPFVAMGILILSSLIKSHWRYAVLSVTLFALSLSVFISPYANIDNRVLTSNSVPRLAFTDEELTGINEICSNWEGEVYTDWYTGYYIYHVQRIYHHWELDKAVDFSGSLISGNYADIPDSALVLVRTDITENPCLIDDRVYKVDYDVNKALETQGFKLTYNNEHVKGYTR